MDHNGIGAFGAIEIRVLGCLMEKEQTTPDYYPMTINALTAACNQKTNRDPVMNVSEDHVLGALDALRRAELVTTTRVAGGRSVKYRHKLAEQWDLSQEQLAVLAVLLLRGEQTPGEIRTRTDRYVTFYDLNAARSTLVELADRGMVVEQDRVPGERENRWRHLVGGDTSGPPSTSSAKRSLSVAEIGTRDVYKLMTGLIVPRPIGWIGSVSTDGIYNLAPYSFFNGVASRPPTVVVAPGMHGGNYKDTLQNLVDTGEFTVNIVSADLAEAMNVTSTTQKGDEFARAGVTPVVGDDVAAPLVAECRAGFECRVTRTVEIGDEEPTAVVVFGEIVRFHIQESIVNERLHVDPLALAPVGRLAGPNYANVTNIYQLIRPD